MSDKPTKYELEIPAPRIGLLDTIWWFLSAPWRTAKLKAEVVSLRAKLWRVEMEDIRSIRHQRNTIAAQGGVAKRIRALHEENDALVLQIRQLRGEAPLSDAEREAWLRANPERPFPERRFPRSGGTP